MLVRAAARRQRRHAARQITEDFQQLYLPFLCPAQLRWNATQSSKPTLRVRNPSPSPKPDRRQSRTLASIAGLPEKSSSLTQDNHSGNAQPPSLRWDYDTASFKPLMLKPNDGQAMTASVWQNGIGGYSPELVQNLYTCLRVFRFERAEQVIRRMAESADVTAKELAYAHRSYLEVRADEINRAPGPLNNFRAMSAWFENEVSAKSVAVPDGAYLAMIRAAIEALDDPERSETVRRFADMSEIPYDEICDYSAYTEREFMMVGAILGAYTEQEREAMSQKAEQAARAEQEQPKEELAQSLYDIPDGDLPKVLAVEQKGQGLKSLKEGLEAMDTELMNDPIILDSSDPHEARMRAVQRERLIERSAASAAVARWKAEEDYLRTLGIGGGLHSRSLGALMWKWYSALIPAIQQELACIKEAMNPGFRGHVNEERRSYGVHLETVSAETAAATTILFVMGVLARGKDRDTGKYSSSLKLTSATHNLGKSIQEESNAAATRKASRKKTRASQPHTKSTNRRFGKSVLDTDQAVKELDWPLAIKVKVGALLVSKLVETATMPVTRQHPRTKEQVTQMQPAFMHKTQYRLGKKQGYLTASPDLIEKLHGEPVGNNICKKLPMVVEPVPWTGFREGGYLEYSTDFIRFPPTDQTPRDYALAAIEKGDMKQVFDAINVLGSIPWRINQDILRVQLDAWNSGEAVGNFAVLNPKVDFPPEPARSSDPSLRKKWLQNVQDLENKKSALHSQRCFQNFQLEIARAFRNEVIYFPHNIDFRGRAYPVPPYLNHMGADNARALMIFAQGKELGSTGLRWLKIHLANVYGYDKASLQEREDFAMAHLADIYDSAENPLKGRKWWLESEDAWQTLAACFELRSALESADPTKYVSHLPIHQDGTCNGLQHYAALGGDEVGARQVNLLPGDRPADVYTAVADEVKAEVEKDFNAGHPIAKILHGKISRKLVKQPVMTNVYGVTYYGAKEQVKKKVEEVFPDITRTDLINHTTLSAYITRKIFKSLGEMFRGAQAIQKWLGVCADRISTSVSREQMDEFGVEKKRKTRGATPKERNRSALKESRELFKTSVIWTTPLRLPVVQPYRAPKSQIISTVMQNITLQEPRAWDPISRRKQLQGFPPNFIHSLDATHMMLSALESKEKGMTFASIHDSFWTHASDIDNLSELLRDAFVHMHGEDVVGRLRQEMIARYQGSFYLAAIDPRTPVGLSIKSRHAEILAERKEHTDLYGSLKPTSLKAELILERERHRLVTSEDPEERAKGEAILTAAAIFGREANEDAIAVANEVADIGLGEMPDDASLAKREDADLTAMTRPVLEESADTDEESQDVEAAAGAEAEAETEAAEQGNDEADTPKDKNDEAKPGEQEPEFNLSENQLRTRLLNHDTGVDGPPVKKTKFPKQIRRLYIWLPLTFPDVPEKGTFDVKRLKQSRYFFH